jgi:hypothetical protein
VLRWSAEKDLWLQRNRGVSFQEVSDAILSPNLTDIIESPGRGLQQAFVVRIREYFWVVPFVIEDAGSIFLKTAYPSRKMMIRYGGSHG